MFASNAPAPVRLFKTFAIMAAVVFVAFTATATPERVVADRPDVAQAPATVLEKHAEDCWTGEAPADVEIPGHVIWQHPDGRTVYSARLVGPALDTLFGDGDLAGSVVAFCR